MQAITLHQATNTTPGQLGAIQAGHLNRQHVKLHRVKLCYACISHTCDLWITIVTMWCMETAHTTHTVTVVGMVVVVIVK